MYMHISMHVMCAGCIEDTSWACPLKRYKYCSKASVARHVHVHMLIHMRMRMSLHIFVHMLNQMSVHTYVCRSTQSAVGACQRWCQARDHTPTLCTHIFISLYHHMFVPEPSKQGQCERPSVGPVHNSLGVCRRRKPRTKLIGRVAVRPEVSTKQDPHSGGGCDYDARVRQCRLLLQWCAYHTPMHTCTARLGTLWTRARRGTTRRGTARHTPPARGTAKCGGV